MLWTIDANPDMRALAQVLPDIEFSSRDGVSLKLQLLVPWNTDKRYPLIVFLQGSGFQSPNVFYELPQLAAYARRGYVVATVTHRNFKDGYPAPEYLKDYKCAVRFLRAHADKYAIDKTRVCAYGTSSGGNTVLMAGLTGDDPAYKTCEYADESDAVQAVVECFGPTDMVGMIEGDEDRAYMKPFAADPERIDACMRAVSPLYLVTADKPCPPTLILHGDADDMVDYSQGERMYEKMLACGKDVDMVRVLGAPHEGPFWSERLHGIIMDYIDRKLAT